MFSNIRSGYSQLMSTTTTTLPPCNVPPASSHTTGVQTTDSGYGTAPSSPVRVTTPTVCEAPPSTRLNTMGGMQVFNKEVGKATLDRFQDVLERLRMPLLDHLRKCRTEFRPIAIKLMVLGCDEQNSKPCIVVLCPKAAVKKVKRFFQQNYAKRVCEAYPPHQIGFEVEVVGQPPRPLKGEPSRSLKAEPSINVWGENYPDNAGPCWAPRVRVSHAGVDRVATLGGYMSVCFQGKECFFGITVGHVLSLEQSNSDQELSTPETEDSDPSDSEDWPLEDENTREGPYDHCPPCPDSATCGDVVSEDGIRETLPWSSLGTVLDASFSRRARNRDWALIEVESTQWDKSQTLRRLAPYNYAPAQRGEATEVRVQNDPSQSGHLSRSPVMMVMPFGDEFVHVYTIALEDDTGKLRVD
jgi:hypothetical protein